MTLGALIVLAVLVVAGIYVPRSNWIHAKSPDASAPGNQSADTSNQGPANQDQANQASSTQGQSAGAAQASQNGSTDQSAGMNTPPSAPATPTASVDSANAMQPQEMPPAAAAMKETPAPSDTSSAKSGHLRTKKLMAQNSGGMPGEAPASAQGAGGSAMAGADEAQMDELEKTVDQLSNRAAAVNSSLDRLQQQQAASGYGLRGDMVEKQASLKSNLAKAEEALQRRDLARAKKYADLASNDADALEKFLGH
jgi:hypothetical protein